MKKLFLVLGMYFLFIGSFAFADSLTISDLLDKAELKQGIGYSFTNHEVEYLSIFDLAEWKDFNLGLGYSSENSVIATLTYPLFSLKEKGVTIPILDLVELEIGLYGGFSRLENFDVTNGDNKPGWNFGGVLKILSIKF